VAKELTALAIEKMKPGPARREIPDGRVGGLYFIVQPNGKRSWAVRFRLGGRPCKFTIGKYPAIDLKTARERAGVAKDRAVEGKDPAAERKAAKAAAEIPANDLVEAVASRFLSQYVKRNLKPATFSEVERILNKEIIPAWRGRRLSEIRRPDIHDLLDSIVDRGAPVTANRALSWLRRMCSWGIECSLIEVNPCTGIKAPACETARDRILTDAELKAVWQAADEQEQPYEQFVKILILSGQRRSEVAEMRWSEIDLAAKLWTLPKERAKNRRQHDIPLSDSAAALLRGLPRIGDSDFIFTLSGHRPICCYHLVKNRIDALLVDDMPAWVFHDLRRTFASGLARLGVNLPVIEKLLNHVSGSFAGIVGVYQRHAFADEKRGAMQTWARHVDSIVRGAAAGNVVELKRGA
jgi:integrase